MEVDRIRNERIGLNYNDSYYKEGFLITRVMLLDVALMAYVKSNQTGKFEGVIELSSQ